MHFNCYAVFIKEWLAVFPWKHFLFMRTEDYSKNLKSSLLEVFRFLDLRKYLCFFLIKILTNHHPVADHFDRMCSSQKRRTQWAHSFIPFIKMSISFSLFFFLIAVFIYSTTDTLFRLSVALLQPMIMFNGAKRVGTCSQGKWKFVSSYRK